MRRREFIVCLGGAAAWPVVTRANQQRIPVVGYLSMNSPENTPELLTPAFARGLKKTGFVPGQNVAFENRFASGRLDRLPALAAELVGRRVDIIYTGGLPATLAAKSVITTIPIIFAMGEDPVREGIVPSLNRPGGNATGVATFGNQLIAKRLELLHLAVPKATVIAFLVNPNNASAEPDTKDAQTAASAQGLTLRVVAAPSERDFEQAFATISREGIGALLIGVEPFFWAKREELTVMAARDAVPALYDQSIFPAVGALMSYGTDFSEMQRQLGVYVGRVLKGAKPADLPVQQPTKTEFVINLRTAKTLGLTVPPNLLAIADEVIE